jgi:hypothetical protein
MLSREEAQDLTNKIKANFAEVGALLRTARDNKVWQVLGYQSFSDWLQFAVGMSRSRAYQLINIAGIEAQIRQLGAFPEDFTVSARTAQEIINYGTPAFLTSLGVGLNEDPIENEDKFITQMNQVRQQLGTSASGASSTVVSLPVTRDMNQHVLIALESLAAQVADFPTPNEVENQHLQSVRSKLQDAVMVLEAQSLAFSSTSEVTVHA